MIETAAVWLDEAMTPALRTFLGPSHPSHRGGEGVHQPSKFSGCIGPAIGDPSGEVGFTNPAISCKSFGERLVRPSEYRGS